MLVTVAHRPAPTAKAALAKMPPVEVPTVSMTRRGEGPVDTDHVHGERHGDQHRQDHINLVR